MITCLYKLSLFTVCGCKQCVYLYPCVCEREILHTHPTCMLTFLCFYLCMYFCVCVSGHKMNNPGLCSHGDTGKVSVTTVTAVKVQIPEGGCQMWFSWDSSTAALSKVEIWLFAVSFFFGTWESFCDFFLVSWGRIRYLVWYEGLIWAVLINVFTITLDQIPTCMKMLQPRIYTV